MRKKEIEHMDKQETVKDIALKQLRILSDESERGNNLGEIAEATKAMAMIIRLLAELG